MSTSIKRGLYLVHRWLGIAACVFFAMWFVSGIVMMYVGYPKLTATERLAHLPPLDREAAYLAPEAALKAAGIGGALQDLRLAAASGGRAVYLATPAAPQGDSPSMHGGHIAGQTVIDAITGQRLAGADRSRAMATAAAFAGTDAGLGYLGMVQEDAFSHARSFGPHRPLHLVALGDEGGTQLYISSATGEVLTDVTRTERIWNFAGAWIHWLYPFRGNVFDRYWADIVDWISIACTVAAVTGAAVGLLRWRFHHPYRSGARTPYLPGMMRWHHIVGLLFALTTITWIFSGLMSMNPWKIFDTGAKPLQIEAMQGGRLILTPEDASPAVLLSQAAGPVRELRWARSMGSNAVAAYKAAGTPIMLDSQTAQPRILEATRLKQAASRLLTAPVVRIETLRDYDFFYYARAEHTMTGGAEKPLPILRVVFDDPHATWVHIDATTGVVLGRLDRGSRASRWLFSMLASWDWLPLLQRRPLWGALLLLLSTGGVILSLTSMVIGWRRLGRKWGAAHAKPRLRSSNPSPSA